MNPEQFAYWLQGFVELNKGAEPTSEQWQSIKEHLATVFTKVTPPVGKTADDMEKAIREYERSQRPSPYNYPVRIC
jgi:hypothetical protein